MPNLTVAENVELGLGYPKRAGAFVAAARACARKAARRARAPRAPDIDPKRKLGTLAIADRRLVMIARGLAADARLLVLDEPTASLTDEEIEHLHDVRARPRATRASAIVYVTHRLQEIFDITDDVAVMRDGKMVFEAPTAERRPPPADRAHHRQRAAVATAGALARRPAPERARSCCGSRGSRRAGVVEDASFSVRAGELLGIAGLVGAGRTELVRLIFGADRAHRRPRARARAAGAASAAPATPCAAGIVLLPEDRRHQGAVQDVLACARTSRCRSWRASAPRPALPLPEPRRERRRGARPGRAAPDQGRATPRARSGTSRAGTSRRSCSRSGSTRAPTSSSSTSPPTGSTSRAKEEVYRLMDELAASRARASIFISSEFTELVGTCNRVLVMREGRLVGEFEGDAVTERALVERCYAA